MKLVALSTAQFGRTFWPSVSGSWRGAMKLVALIMAQFGRTIGRQFLVAGEPQ